MYTSPTLIAGEQGGCVYVCVSVWGEVKRTVSGGVGQAKHSPGLLF